MSPVRPEMQKAGPSTRVTVPPCPGEGFADDVQGLVTAGHATQHSGAPPPSPPENPQTPAASSEDLRPFRPIGRNEECPPVGRISTPRQEAGAEGASTPSGGPRGGG